VVVFVTHDVTEALLLGDRVIVLSTQPARIIDDFIITELKPRSSEWLAGPEVRLLHERVVGHLRASGTRGNVRVSV
jgi:ABC-type nitrate/sulfonate/bicarbonate transport system ATPase subunit